MKSMKHKKIIPFPIFLKRITHSLIIGFLIIVFFLGIGMLGYHHFEDKTWTSSFEHASMILSGMGPLSEMNTNGGKIFAGIYALASGVIFLVVIGLVAVPLFHRFLQYFHIAEDKRPK